MATTAPTIGDVIARLSAERDDALRALREQHTSYKGESLTSIVAERDKLRQLAAITKPELKRLIDTLSDCACFITDNMDETNADEAGLLLARCDNVLDAHEHGGGK